LSPPKTKASAYSHSPLPTTQPLQGRAYAFMLLFNVSTQVNHSSLSLSHPPPFNYGPLIVFPHASLYQPATTPPTIQRSTPNSHFFPPLYHFCCILSILPLCICSVAGLPVPLTSVYLNQSSPFLSMSPSYESLLLFFTLLCFNFRDNAGLCFRRMFGSHFPSCSPAFCFFLSLVLDEVGTPWGVFESTFSCYSKVVTLILLSCLYPPGLPDPINLLFMTSTLLIVLHLLSGSPIDRLRGFASHPPFQRSQTGFLLNMSISIVAPLLRDPPTPRALGGSGPTPWLCGSWCSPLYPDARVFFCCFPSSTLRCRDTTRMRYPLPHLMLTFGPPRLDLEHCGFYWALTPWDHLYHDSSEIKSMDACVSPARN